MIAIVGGGRMGRGLALALAEAGERVALWSRRESGGVVAGAVAGAATVLLAVPDDAIGAVAATLAATPDITSEQVVLHLSGRLDCGALQPLSSSGAGLGSFHPLQTISDPRTAGALWRGAYAAVEGDARAVLEGERLAVLLGLLPVRIATGAKAAYHAAAVVASNYVVALAGMAARLAQEAGVAPALAEAMYLPLLAGAVENLGKQPPADALTGPIRRGDVATVAAHLRVLPPGDRRLYAVVGLEALRLARISGLAAGPAEEMGRLLGEAAGAGGTGPGGY